MRGLCTSAAAKGQDGTFVDGAGRTSVLLSKFSSPCRGEKCFGAFQAEPRDGSGAGTPKSTSAQAAPIRPHCQ